MSLYHLKIKLLSDTTFGRGDGVAGLIDSEVEHDSDGFPYLRGRTLKGLLSEECDNLIAVLPAGNIREHWQKVACAVFGSPGSSLNTMASIHVGDAMLPKDLRQAIAYQIHQENKLTKTEVLDALTTIRRQTSIQPDGTPDKGSLRSFRVVIRQLDYTCDLIFEAEKTEIEGVLIERDEMLSLLAVGALALRYLGSGRNRGRGHVQCKLCDNKQNDITAEFINCFGTLKEAIE
jgi:RAMP superfamily